MGHVAQLATSRSRFPYAVDYTDRLVRVPREQERGGYANVYQYRSPSNGILYAVKELKALPDHLAEHLTLHEIAMKEYDIWNRLRHHNILQLEGIYYPSPDIMIPCFVTRWQENGRVKDYVRNKPGTNFLDLIDDIADGVAYLHDNDIIHGDLRGSNILISDDGRALVTDFGISKNDPGDGIPVSNAFQGNWRWMAREFFPSDAQPPALRARRSKASDIWMFGLLIQEILSGKIPYYDISAEWTVARKIGDGEPPRFPDAQHDSWKKFDDPVRRLRLRYCASEPADRPTITLVLQDIRKLRIRFPNISSSENDSNINSGSSATPAEGNASTNTRSESASETDESTIRLSEGFSYLNLSTNSRTFSTDSSRTSASPTRGSVTMASNAALNGSGTTSSGRLQDRNERNMNPGSSHGSREQSTSIYATIDLDNELHNYIARQGLTSRFTETQYPAGPDEMRTWQYIMKLDGKIIATAKARQVKQAKKEAARIALAKLRSDTKPSPVSTPFQSGGPPEPDTYRKEGPPHNPTWIYTLYNNGRVVEGHGKNKTEARQNARLQLTLSPSRS